MFVSRAATRVPAWVLCPVLVTGCAGEQGSQTAQQPSTAVVVEAPPDTDDAAPAPTSAPPSAVGGDDQDYACNDDPTNADTAAARAAFSQAIREYRQGAYDGAIKLFFDAYRQACKHLLLFNIAQAQINSGDKTAAKRTLEVFLEREDPEAAAVATARKLLEKL